VIDRNGSVTLRSQSDQLQRRICAEMKSKGVIVFTVGFTAGAGQLDARALALLKDCASSAQNFLLASNREALHQAFASIGKQLNDLRLAR
jgi:hypothetical protein